MQWWLSSCNLWFCDYKVSNHYEEKNNSYSKGEGGSTGPCLPRPDFSKPSEESVLLLPAPRAWVLPVWRPCAFSKSQPGA